MKTSTVGPDDKKFFIVDCSIVWYVFPIYYPHELVSEIDCN